MTCTARRGVAVAGALLALAALPGPPEGGDGAATFRIGPVSLGAQEAPPARETTVVVRAVAHDAKLIGTGVGGARVTIRDAATGDTLAAGAQEGGTGSTERIVRRPHERGSTVYGTEGAAKFEATLSLREPTRVEVVAEGPLDTPHATQRSSVTTLLVPGRDVTGEGVVVELYGLTVRLERPGAGAAVAAGRELPVRAHVEMLCGCPLTPGGLWDADRYDVTARLTRDGRTVRETTLSYAGEASTFEGRLPAAEPGRYELVVVAEDADRANAGVARRTLRVPPRGSR